MKASKLFERLIDDHTITDVIGSLDVEITGIHIDSRNVKQGNVFVAIKGLNADGHDFIGKAIALGASLVVCQEFPNEIPANVTFCRVADSRNIAALSAHRFYDYPSSKMKVVGVTGTNGKTTVTTLLFQLYTALGYKCGLISTVENKVGDKIIATEHTTPDPCTLAQLFSTMYEEGCSHVFMEVSSHAIDQKRIEGIEFEGAVFTNITHDHLDYHQTFKAYIYAKKKFFDHLPAKAFALTNIDDKNGEVMVQNCKAHIKTYALRRMADFKCKLISDDLYGMQIRINDAEMICRLTGEFNAYNLTAVTGVASLMGEDLLKVMETLSSLPGAEGRMEKVIVGNIKIVGIVDYAHTPDALENVLRTLKASMPKDKSLITVVGCGGNRDAAKRPIMAHIAASNSSKVILTSDNPRHENPEEILDQMEAGLSVEQKPNVLRITDRASAIKTAVMLAKAGDAILVAGKGHEKYQDIGGVKTPFEDKKVLASALEAKT